MTTAFLFLSLLLLLLIGTPIGVALGLSSILTITFFTDESFASVPQTLYGAMTGHYTLLAIPFFILASAFLTTGGVAKRLIRFAIACVGHLRGGLAMASVLACMFFAAVSGSSPATVVAIGSIVIAGMVKAGYTKEFAAGVICNAGTLGILIPPSIVMVVYASATDTSVGRLFLAGVIPGIVAGLMLMIGIYFRARALNIPRLERASWREWFAALGDSFWGLTLIVVIMGGIYSGVFTPTEAAAVASVYAFFIANFVYRDMGPLKDDPGNSIDNGTSVLATMAIVFPLVFGGILWAVGDIDQPTFMAPLIYGAGIAVVIVGIYVAGSLLAGTTINFSGLLSIAWRTIRHFLGACVHRDTGRVLIEAGRTVIMLMFIIANAILFAHVLTSERIPHLITELIIGAGFEPWVFLIIVNIILLIAGNFMDPTPILLIMAPILFPIALELGIDPIHLGIIMVVNMEIGLITPPVGLNLFVTSGITGMKLLAVAKAALPWLGILLIFLMLVTYVPILSVFLPNLVYGPLI